VRWFRGQTIRWRITIWSFLVALVLVALAGFGFLVAVKGIVAIETQAVLTSYGAPYEAAIHDGATKSFAKPGEQQLIALIDPSGTVRLTNLPASLNNQMLALLKLPDGVHSIAGDDGLRYDVSVEGTFGSDPTEGPWEIVSARNAASGEAVLDSLQQVLIGGGIALAFGFGFAAWIVSSLSLRPVTRLRREASLLSHSAGAGTLPIGPVRDELSALAETLNEFINSVRASADRERQMVADASHELRTPIAVLTTQLQLAHLSSGDAAALEKEIAAAELTLERLSNITTDLLTLSRIEAPDPADAAPATSADDILIEFLAAMDRGVILGSAHRVSVEFTTEGVDARARVAIPALDFARLVDNLVSNAIAASPNQSQVEVELVQQGSDLVLTVLDSGYGMSDDFLGAAFDRFSRGTTSRGRFGGTGLGLAIVKAIVVRSGGDVSLEPRAEGGIRATVRLPLLPVT
jgi:two-component system OmpR family sensor kinase